MRNTKERFLVITAKGDVFNAENFQQYKPQENGDVVVTKNKRLHVISQHDRELFIAAKITAIIRVYDGAMMEVRKVLEKAIERRTIHSVDKIEVITNNNFEPNWYVFNVPAGFLGNGRQFITNGVKAMDPANGKVSKMSKHRLHLQSMWKSISVRTQLSFL